MSTLYNLRVDNLMFPMYKLLWEKRNRFYFAVQAFLIKNLLAVGEPGTKVFQVRLPSKGYYWASLGVLQLKEFEFYWGGVFFSDLLPHFPD